MGQKIDYLNDSKYDNRKAYKVISAIGYAKVPASRTSQILHR